MANEIAKQKQISEENIYITAQECKDTNLLTAVGMSGPKLPKNSVLGLDYSSKVIFRNETIMMQFWRVSSTRTKNDRTPEVPIRADGVAM